MFKPAKMKKVQAVVLQSARDEVVSKLHEMGVIQLRETSHSDFIKRALGEDFQEVSGLLSKLKDIQSELGASGSSRPTPVKEYPHEKIVKNAKKIVEKLEPEVAEIRERRQEIMNERQTLLNQTDALHDFMEIEFPLEYIHSTEEFYVAAGRISEENLEEFTAAANDALQSKVLVKFLGRGERKTLVVACRVRDQSKLTPLIYRFGVEMLELPPTTAVPKKAMEEIAGKLEVTNDELNKIQNEASKLAKKWGKEIWHWMELLEIRKERLEACSNFGYSESAVLMEGWVPEKSVTGLENMLGRTTKGRCIFHAIDVPKEEAESAPTKLENPPLIRDFEFITEMYGSPSPTEADPTPFIAITFPIFFGICLGDVGYGALLAAIMISGFWIGGAFPRNIRRMLAISGGLAIVFGLLTGSLFGPNIPALWFDPVKDPVSLLKLAIFLGILQIFIAFSVVKLLKDAFRREWKRVCLEDIARALVILGFFGLGFCILGINLRTFGINFSFPKMALTDAFNPLAPAAMSVTILRAMFYVGVLAGVVGAIALVKETRSKVSGAINVFYGVIGFIADVTSYSRLMALGVATTIIAYLLNFVLIMTFNGMVAPNLTLSPALILAIVMMVGIALVFLIGHSFNTFLGCMGGFIHTLRLHFAEFFSKFYDGTGQKFAPFKAKRVFTEVKGGE